MRTKEHEKNMLYKDYYFEFDENTNKHIKKQKISSVGYKDKIVIGKKTKAERLKMREEEKNKKIQKKLEVNKRKKEKELRKLELERKRIEKSLKPKFVKLTEEEKKNREKIVRSTPEFKKKVSEYNKKKRASDPLYKLKANTRCLIKNSFINGGFNKGSKTESILGCSFKEFKSHLEKHFEPWMNWENWGKYNGTPNFGWDIDHDIALKTATTEEEIIKLNHYTNLQPLCSYLNRAKKRDKAIKVGEVKFECFWNEDDFWEEIHVKS